MSDIKAATAITALVSGVMGAAPAVAETVRYDFTATFGFSEDEVAEGSATGFFEYETGVTSESGFGEFFNDFLSFEINYSGGPTDGRSFSSADGGRGSIIQDIGTSFISLNGDDIVEDFGFSFGNFATDRNISALIDTADFRSGGGYGSIAFDTSLTDLNVSASIAPVPLPPAGALLALVAGGAALLSTAKKRRSKKAA